MLAEWPASSAAALRPEGLLCSVAESTEDKIDYVLEGTVNGAGSAIAWAIDELGISFDGSPPVDAWFASAAKMIESEEMPLFLNTIGGVGSPLWKTGISATWVDRLGQEVDPASLGTDLSMVAVVESILFLVRLNLDAMRSGGLDVGWIGVSGGLARSDAVCEFLADLTGSKVRRADVSEATSAGVALLAARSDGVCASVDSITTIEFCPRELSRAVSSRYASFIQLMTDL